MDISDILWPSLPAAPTRSVTPGLFAGGFAFVLTVAFVPWLGGAADSPRWAMVALGSTAALWISFRVTAGHWIGLGLLAWAGLSMLWTAGPYEGVDELAKLLFLAGLFVIGSGLPSLRPVLIGLAIGMAVNSALATAQMFGFEGVPQLGGPAGLFMVKNYLAEPAALVLVWLVAARMWWWALAVLPAVLLPGGRGALAALVACAIAWLWTKSRPAAVALILVAGLGAGALAVRGDSSVTERFAIWRATAAGLTWTGSGIGSFYARLPSHAPDLNLTVKRPAHAHNDMLELTYELGPGVLLFVALMVLALFGPAGPERYVLIGFLMEGCFGFPLHFPVTAALAAVAAGHLCATGAALRGGVAHR